MSTDNNTDNDIKNVENVEKIVIAPTFFKEKNSLLNFYFVGQIL